MRERYYYVYMITTWRNTALYIGVTNNLERRLREHRDEVNDGFSKRYHTHKLVWFEQYRDIRDAIGVEKRLKGWTRAKKEALIAEQNPYWKDLTVKD